MYEQLKILLKLQKVDMEIDRIENQKASEPARLKALENNLSKYKEKSEEKSKIIDDLQKQQRELQRQLGVQQAKIDKYKSQRLAVKTNKEYTALELEISDLESNNSKLEEEILNIMVSIDNANIELKSAQNDLRNQESIFQIEKDKIISEVKELNRQIALWNKRRGIIASKISQSLMTRYDNWRKRKKTSFVAIIDGQTCGGCHLTLPPQLINEVRKKKDLISCNSCGRLLYWLEEETPEDKQ